MDNDSNPRVRMPDQEREALNENNPDEQMRRPAPPSFPGDAALQPQRPSTGATPTPSGLVPRDAARDFRHGGLQPRKD